MSTNLEKSHGPHRREFDPERLADRELARRSPRVAIMYVPAAILLILLTRMHVTGPELSAAFLAFIVAGGAVRTVWARRFRTHYDRDRTAWRYPFLGLVMVTGLAWGAAVAAMLVHFGQGWNFFNGLLMIAGIAFSAIGSLSPRPRLFRCFVASLLAPTIVALMLRGDLRSAGLAVVLVVYFIQMNLLATYFQKEFLQVRRNAHLLTERATALEHAHARLAAVDKAKSRFMANMSHEIRTPLNGIIGMAGVLAESELDEDQTACLDDVRQSGEILLRIVNEFLDFSSIESGEIELENRVFDLRQVVDEATRPQRLAAEGRGNTLSVDIDRFLPRHVTGDSHRVWQVLTNLVSNAIKFTRDGQVAVVVSQADEQPDWIVFEIVDTGIGLSAEALEYVFAPFRQADESTSRRYGGTGLGLATAKQTVELMGGTIAARSEPGRGSTFAVTLPLPCGEPESVASPVSADDAPLDLHVLLAEDNEVNARLAERLLSKSGCRVQRVADGRDAVAVWEAGKFDLVLMDVQMPIMDGLAAAAEIRRREAVDGSRAPIVALTAHALTGYRERCLAAGMDDYLTKPIKYESLRAVLKHWSPGRDRGSRNRATAPAGA